MAEDDDKSQKTEEPSQKRIEDAIKKGNVAYSREVTSFIMLLLLTVFIVFVSPPLFKQAAVEMSAYVSEPHHFEKDYDGDDVFRLAIKLIFEVILFVAAPFIIAFAGAFLGSFLQNGIITSPEAIMPKLSKISPMNGLKRLFSAKSLVEFVKGIVKLTVIGMTAYFAVYSEISVIHVLHDVSIASLMAVLLNIVTKMMIAICVLQGIIAVIDLIYERVHYYNSLKMTKQEVKDEMKQTEGDPEIKGRIRSLRIQRSRQRIAAAVPKADVVITNPTHFSVALQYDTDTMHAPKLVAKGQDQIAFRIREIAKEHDIPIIESPPLARSLYDNVEWDQFIQVEHYQAVAQIMTTLRKFANKKKKKK